MRLLIALLAGVAAFSVVTAALDWRTPRPVRTRPSRPPRRSKLQQRLDQSGAGISASRYRLTVADAEGREAKARVRIRGG